VSLIRRAATGLIGAAILASIVVSPIAEASPTSSCWKYRSQERGFTRKINEARSNHGISRLQLDPQLSRVARRHTREMLGANNLFHTPSNRLRRRVTRWVVLGENVGVGGTVRSLHTAFMASPTHRENILYRSYRYVGVGTREVGGRLWVTVIFESRNNPGTRLEMPRC
jgi:uncharacterized protein YkwD